MATYIEKHSIVTEDTLNVDHNSRETFQHVKFMNPQNEYCGFITSNSYHILDDQSKTTYNMSVKDGHLLLSSNAGEVKLVDFSQIKDILSYDAIEDQASIPSIKLLSTLHDMYIAEMQKLNSSKVALSGENEISGKNAIEQLSSKLIVADELSAAQLSIATLNDFFADGKSLSSILQNTDTNVVKLCADLSSEVRNLSNALSDELNTLSIDVKEKQDKLTDAQIFAIDSVVDELQTEVKFENGTTARYDVDGELTQEIRQKWEQDSGSAVAEVRIGSSVTSIGQHSFQNCSSLTSVTIPNSVISIGQSALLGCSGLMSVVFNGKTLAEVQEMANYHWDIADSSIISTWNIANEEWVEGKLSIYASQLTAHTNNTNIHIKATERSVWNAKYDKPLSGIPKSDLAADVQASLDKADSAIQEHQSLAAYVNAASYDSTVKKILLKHDSVTVADIDASAFIKDGMLSAADLRGNTLVLTFNTDGLPDPVSVDLSSIVPDVTGKADKVKGLDLSGHLAALDENGNLVDGGKSVADIEREIQDSTEALNDLSSYLPLSGGQMSGDIDMGGDYGLLEDSHFLKFIDRYLGNGLVGSGFGVYKAVGDEGLEAQYVLEGTQLSDDGSEFDVMRRMDIVPLDRRLSAVESATSSFLSAEDVYVRSSQYAPMQTWKAVEDTAVKTSDGNLFMPDGSVYALSRLELEVDGNVSSVQLSATPQYSVDGKGHYTYIGQAYTTVPQPYYFQTAGGITLELGFNVDGQGIYGVVVVDQTAGQIVAQQPWHEPVTECNLEFDYGGSRCKVKATNMYSKASDLNNFVREFLGIPDDGSIVPTLLQLMEVSASLENYLPLSGGEVSGLSVCNQVSFIDSTNYSNKFIGISGGDFNYQTFDSNGQAVGGAVLMPHGSTELIDDKYFKTRHIACIDDIVEALDNYHPLSNKQYDFNDQNSIKTALYDMISALGGTVVNFSPSSKEQDAIRELYPEGTVESIDQLTHGLKYEFNDDEHTASLLAFANDNSANNSFASGAVIVPPYVDKQGNVSLFNDDNFYKVTSIAGVEDTYSYNLTLKSIIAPSTVLSVEGGAFANCVELSSAMFNSIKYIGNNAFDYCEKLKTADVYTAEYIGQYAFANCMLLDISMPLNCLSAVSKGAFSYCENLSSITLPLLEVVEQNTFEQCYNLSSIFLPAVKHINAAFDGAFNIKVINFGNELENLPTFSNSTFNDVKCKFIVPDNLYDSLPDDSWSILYYDSNYEFVKYSENA